MVWTRLVAAEMDQHKCFYPYLRNQTHRTWSWIVCGEGVDKSGVKHKAILLSGAESGWGFHLLRCGTVKEKIFRGKIWFWISEI